MTQDDATAAFTLLLPGKTLYLSKLLALKKFRNKGNKDGAVRAFFKLEEEELGKVLEVEGGKGVCFYGSNQFECKSYCCKTCIQQYEFAKVEVPDGLEDRKKLAKKLQKYNIALMQYMHTLQQELKS